MKLWNDLDNNTQKIIKISLGLFFVAVICFCWFNIFKINNKLNDFIVVSRSPIREVRLISAIEKKDGFYVTVVDKQTAKSYEDIFITKTCPNFRVLIGSTMNISVLLKDNPTTGESKFELGRAYDYICTKKNMELVDKDFLESLRKADEAFLNDSQGGR